MLALTACSPTTTAVMAADRGGGEPAPGYEGAPLEDAPALPDVAFTDVGGAPYDLDAAMRERPTPPYLVAVGQHLATTGAHDVTFTAAVDGVVPADTWSGDDRSLRSEPHTMHRRLVLPAVGSRPRLIRPDTITPINAAVTSRGIADRLPGTGRRPPTDAAS
jgi:hypothetical protein